KEACMGTYLTTGFTATSLALATPTTLKVLPNEEGYRVNLLWTLSTAPYPMDDSNPTVEIVATTRQGAAKRWLPSAGMRTRTKRRTRALAVLVSLPVWLCCGNAQAASTGTPGLSVIPRPSTRLGLSYFKIRAQPGTSVQAGAVELQN